MLGHSPDGREESDVLFAKQARCTVHCRRGEEIGSSFKSSARVPADLHPIASGVGLELRGLT